MPFSDRLQIEGRIRALHELGSSVDDVRLEPAGTEDRLVEGDADP